MHGTPAAAVLSADERKQLVEAARAMLDRAYAPYSKFHVGAAILTEAALSFLTEAKWTDRVYFEDGLSRALRIVSIPTTIVVGRDGQVFTRINGYVPGTFVEQLTGKIRDAL